MRGSPLIVTQVPTLFCSAQAWHWPPQALSQQTLSTQNPLVHCALLWHWAPCALSGRQIPVVSQ